MGGVYRCRDSGCDRTRWWWRINTQYKWQKQQQHQWKRRSLFTVGQTGQCQSSNSLGKLFQKGQQTRNHYEFSSESIGSHENEQSIFGKQVFLVGPMRSWLRGDGIRWIGEWMVVCNCLTTWKCNWPFVVMKLAANLQINYDMQLQSNVSWVINNLRLNQVGLHKFIVHLKLGLRLVMQG